MHLLIAVVIVFFISSSASRFVGLTEPTFDLRNQNESSFELDKGEVCGPFIENIDVNVTNSSMKVLPDFFSICTPSPTSKFIRSTEPTFNLRNQNVSSLALNIGEMCNRYTKYFGVNVINSSLEVLPSRLFGNCTFLEALNLSKNDIVEIEHNTFENLPGFNCLDLSLNQIIALPINVFAPLEALMDLMEGNRIRIIHSDLFIHNEILMNLDLSNNSLKTIAPKSFRNNLYLKYLYVNDNPNLSHIDLFPDERIVNIMEFNISNCGLTQLHIPKNVEKIEARSNKINSITAHPESVLKILDIRQNNLMDLADLPQLNNLEDLDMLENDLELNNFNNLKQLTSLTITLRPMQNISAVDLGTHFPKLKALSNQSFDMSIEQEQRITNHLRQSVKTKKLSLKYVYFSTKRSAESTKYPQNLSPFVVSYPLKPVDLEAQ